MSSWWEPMRVVADDLSGAAEAAGILCRHGLTATVVLEPGYSSDSATVLDLHVRNAGRDASGRIYDGLHRGKRVDYVKIDSQLRGPVALLVQATAESSVVVFAPALPRLRRTVLNGVLLIDGVPLSTSARSAWRTEPGEIPERLADVIPSSLPTRHFGVEAVRSGEFARELAEGRQGEVFVPDACSSDDLRVIAAAIGETSGAVTPIGSAGLLEAMVSSTSASPYQPSQGAGAARKVVLVLGSLEPVLALQRAALTVDATTVLVRSDLDDAAVEALIASALEQSTRAVVVVTEPSDGPHDVSIARRIGQATADAVRSDPQIAMALIGGETARQTLQSSGEERLSVVGEIHPGAVLSVTARGRRVVTRPGSFGAVDSLNQITITLLGGEPRDLQEEGTQ